MNTVMVIGNVEIGGYSVTEENYMKFIEDYYNCLFTHLKETIEEELWGNHYITVPLEVGEKIALADNSDKSLTKYLGTIEPDEEDHEGMIQGYDGKWRWL